MNSKKPLDPLVELNVNAMGVGREWLTQIQNAAPEMFLIDPKTTDANMTVVSIPDFRDESVIVSHSESVSHLTQMESVSGEAEALEMPVDVNTREIQSVPCDEDVEGEAERAQYVESLVRNEISTPIAAVTRTDDMFESYDMVSVQPAKSGSSNVTRTDDVNERMATAANLIRPTFKVEDINDVASKISQSMQQSNIPVAKPIVADLREKPSEWGTTNVPGAAKPDRSQTNTATTENVLADNQSLENVDSESIAQLVEQIIERFPLNGPVVLMFAGSEWNPHVDETCAQVAYRLASRDIGKIALVDCEMECSSLSKASGVSESAGVLDVLTINTPVECCIIENEVCNLEFIPIGQEKIRQWAIAEQKVRPLVAELKSTFQFACVSVGDAHSRMAKAWAAEADGTFLVVSMANSSRTVADSAVKELQKNGARILGCVATEAYA